MFIAKKLIASFLMPLPLGLTVCIIGIILLWFSRRQQTGKLLVTIGVLSILLFSSRFVANVLLGPLENAYPRYQQIEGQKTPVYVVVLGGGHSANQTLRSFDQLYRSSVKRVLEGVYQSRHLNAQLVLSGGAPYSNISNAELMADLATRVGVPKERILVENRSRDTGEQAQYLQSMVKDDSFLLVTEASHLPRAMRIFEKQGMKPIPQATW
ncbi:MAG: ElyC/SanA/YdcF family protein [Pseudomonadales bacterium]|nr:ElyC/SanA/YdcF family protein [Pseudomonadales bacterium]